MTLRCNVWACNIDRHASDRALGHFVFGLVLVYYSDHVIELYPASSLTRSQIQTTPPGQMIFAWLVFLAAVPGTFRVML